ncbi:plectin isoform X29 [Silurus meridionalis]|nr:plectin isoform X29 [Silurus meridionalis]
MEDFSGHYGNQEGMGQTSFRPDSSNIHMESSQSNDLMLELKNLFKKMKETDGTTKGITHSLRISNVHEQQDAVEYYQKILKAANSQASKIFEGVISNNSTCPNKHIFIEKHHFFTIPLAIEVGHSGMFEMLRGLQTFFDLVKLDEDNWLYCKDCGEKTETQTWTDIKVFPTILTLYLKRFYFDYNQMRPVKNHCSINISPKLEIKNIGYSLYAVINHYGDESGGHYNVFIKSFEDGEWYLFDDSSVTREPCCSPKLVKVNGDAYLSYVASLKEDLQVVSDQVKLSLEKVDQLAGQMHAYRQCYDWLIQWIAGAKKWQEDIEAQPVSDKKALKKQLAQAKELLVEIKNKEDKVKECKNQAFAYVNLIKYHEYQLEACRAFVESFRFTSVESASNSIMEEKELPEPRNLTDEEIKSQQVQEALLSQNKIEENNTVDSFRKVAQEAEEKHGKPANENFATEQEAVQQIHKAKEDCETFKQQAEEDAGEHKECTDKEANQHPQNTHETEQQNQAPEAEAAKHAKAQEHSEKLRNMPKIDGKNEFHQPHAVAIQGVYIEDTKEQLSIYEAMKKNMIGQDDAIDLLKAQAATGYIIDPIKNLKLTVKDAVEMEVVGNEFKDTLLFAEQAVTGFINPSTGMVFSLFQAMKKGMIDKYQCLPFLEAQIATGGIIDPEASHRLPVKVACEHGLFDDETNYILNDTSNYTKKPTYRQLLEQCIIDPETGLALLLLKKKKHERNTSSDSSVHKFSGTREQEWEREMGPVAGIVVTGKDAPNKLSVIKAIRCSLVDNITGLRLLEAQACTGGIIDPDTGKKFTIKDALDKGLVKDTMVAALTLAQKAFHGFEVSKTKTKMSVGQALNESLLTYETGQRFLEFQYLTGGLIEPGVAGRLSLDDAVKKGTVDTVTAQKLQDVNRYSKNLICPKTKLKISYREAIGNSLIENRSGLRFLEASL